MPTTEPQTESRKTSSPGRAEAYSVILRDEFGVSFAFFDGRTGDRVREADAGDRPWPEGDWPGRLAVHLVDEDKPLVRYREEGCFVVAMAFHEAGQPSLVGMGLLNAIGRSSAEVERERERLQKWAESVLARHHLMGQCLGLRKKESATANPNPLAWEALLTMDGVLRRIRLHKEPEKNQSRILQAASRLLRARTVAWVPAQSPEAAVVGDDLHAREGHALVRRLGKEFDWRKDGHVLCDRVQDRRWGQEFPRIASLLAVPVPAEKAPDWVVAINKNQPGDKTAGYGGETAEWVGRAPAPPPETIPFRGSDAVLLTPYVTLLDLQARSSRRYGDLKEFLVSLTRILTSTIDLKDARSLGHSERVARIAVELGKSLRLAEDSLSDLYLAGLLHDIGMAGVDNAVLHKKEELTPEEFHGIQQHVAIGCHMLEGLRPLRPLLPAVLHHHERYDGSGYPAGLRGDAIPLAARILAVADGYDALRSARVNRPALSHGEATEILARESGMQWDPRVIEAFLRCHARIEGLGHDVRGETHWHARDHSLT